MSKPIVKPTGHTVKHTPRAYLVLCPAGHRVARYPFDPDEFHSSRRVAYREALDDAAVRDEALAVAEGRAWAEAA